MRSLECLHDPDRLGFVKSKTGMLASGLSDEQCPLLCVFAVQVARAGFARALWMHGHFSFLRAI